jgi:hypothetical protein
MVPMPAEPPAPPAPPAWVLDLDNDAHELMLCMCAAYWEKTRKQAGCFKVQSGPPALGIVAINPEEFSAMPSLTRSEKDVILQRARRWRRMTAIEPEDAAVFWEQFGPTDYRISIYPRRARLTGPIGFMLAGLAEREAR